jgi:hypothetical protein
MFTLQIVFSHQIFLFFWPEADKKMSVGSSSNSLHKDDKYRYCFFCDINFTTCFKDVILYLPI